MNGYSLSLSLIARRVGSWDGQFAFTNHFFLLFSRSTIATMSSPTVEMAVMDSHVTIVRTSHLSMRAPSTVVVSLFKSIISQHKHLFNKN